MTWLFLKQRNVLRPGIRILHVAPEKCLREKLMALSGVDYTAGDKHEPGYSYPSGTADLDITSIGYPNDHFDLILCSHVLEHVTDDRRAMHELHRVLKPGGLGILMVPIALGNDRTLEDASVTDPKERVRLYGQFDHVRLYGRDYVDRLRESGFQVTEDAMTERMTAEEVFRFGLLRSEVVHAVTK